MFKKLKSHINYNYRFLKVLNSPFKGLKLWFYFGKIAIGTPYFLPRRWRKVTELEARETTKKEFEKNGLLVKNKTFEEVLERNRRCTTAEPIKYFGWHFHTLGWKTKYDDYRFEFNPGLSIVLFGKQLCIGIQPNIPKDTVSNNVYWETWLVYEYETNHKLSKKERLKELLKIVSLNYTTYFGDKDKTTTDYGQKIFKKKYLKFYDEIKGLKKLFNYIEDLELKINYLPNQNIQPLLELFKLGEKYFGDSDKDLKRFSEWLKEPRKFLSGKMVGYGTFEEHLTYKTGINCALENLKTTIREDLKSKINATTK